jgi:uncharacterized lipoprotein YmbA
MEKSPFIKTYVFLLFSLLFLISGCAGSQSSRFYTLNSINTSAPFKDSFPHSLSVAVGPVEIPDYLDRPQIVIRTSQNELTLSEYDRWAGSLRDDIERVLSEDLSKLMMPEQISVIGWGWGVAYDYRVAVVIAKFDIMPDRNILLKADWRIIGKNETTLMVTETNYTEPVREQTYQGQVSSMSRALEKLSRDIAEGIKSVSRKKK